MKTHEKGAYWVALELIARICFPYQKKTKGIGAIPTLTKARREPDQEFPSRAYIYVPRRFWVSEKSNEQRETD